MARMMASLVGLIQTAFYALFAPFAFLFKVNPKKVVFGAWGGNQFSDNPKYFLRYLAANTDYACYWIGRNVVKELVQKESDVHFIPRYSLAAIWHVLTARYLVCNIHWEHDILRFPIYGRSVCLNFWHGTSLKKIGEEQYNGQGNAPAATVSKARQQTWLLTLKQLRRRFDAWAIPQGVYTTCASEKMVDILHRSCPPRFAQERTIVAGQPRNDFLMKNCHDAKLIEQIKKNYGAKLGIPADKRWYLYLPTWRHDGKDTYSFLRAGNKDRLLKILERQNAVLIEKQHPIILNLLHLGGVLDGNIHVLSVEDNRKIDIQELLLASDRLITDYSSCFFDFELMKRPTIHFAYDYDQYANLDSGLEYDLHDISAGPVVATEMELLNALEMDDECLWNRRGKLADEPISGETGHACETFARWMQMI